MNEVLHWLRPTPEWAARGGQDHFIVSGHIIWDNQRATDRDSDWGSKFMLVLETRNMTVLDIESNKWHASEKQLLICVGGRKLELLIRIGVETTFAVNYTVRAIFIASSTG
ncbi:hypothetical protein FCM35_KLT20174 [Carex littledalei]|uniref:Exostosin GT47 domain-containing protein n=1 Tax=Carex littledalei TaxID=544730 RepID=A0A833VDU9_9POAL|nr:hypothetical protein FCM35_KLT20174 [Carex littledalei]